MVSIRLYLGILTGSWGVLVSASKVLSASKVICRSTSGHYIDSTAGPGLLR